MVELFEYVDCQMQCFTLDEWMRMKKGNTIVCHEADIPYMQVVIHVNSEIKGPLVYLYSYYEKFADVTLQW